MFVMLLRRYCYTLTHLTRALTSLVFFVGSIKTNAFLSLAGFCRIFVFSFIVAGEFGVAHAKAPSDLVHA